MKIIICDINFSIKTLVRESLKSDQIKRFSSSRRGISFTKYDESVSHITDNGFVQTFC